MSQPPSPIFEAAGNRKATLDYANLNGIWKARELVARCVDKVLGQTVTNKLVCVMRAQEKRGKVKRAGLRADGCVWASPKDL